MLDLKAALGCLKVEAASYPPEAFSQDSLAPKSCLPALLCSVSNPPRGWSDRS